METKIKSSNNKKNKQALQKSQVLGTEGGVMPDPNRKQQSSVRSDAEAAFKNKSPKQSEPFDKK